MKIQAINIDMEVLGSQFANMDSNDQAAFFKGLARELRFWRSTHRAQMQFCMVGSELCAEDKQMLEDTVSCAWYKSE